MCFELKNIQPLEKFENQRKGGWGFPIKNWFSNNISLTTTIMDLKQELATKGYANVPNVISTEQVEIAKKLFR